MGGGGFEFLYVRGFLEKVGYSVGVKRKGVTWQI